MDAISGQVEAIVAFMGQTITNENTRERTWAEFMVIIGT